MQTESRLSAGGASGKLEEFGSHFRTAGRRTAGFVGLVQLMEAATIGVGLLAVVVGLTIVGRCDGSALMWIGAGLALTGTGGAVALHTWHVGIVGAAGVVLLLIGAALGSLSIC